MSYKLPSSLYITKPSPTLAQAILEGFLEGIQFGRLGETDFNRLFKLFTLNVRVHHAIRQALGESKYEFVKEILSAFELSNPLTNETQTSNPSLRPLTKKDLEKIERFAPLVDANLIPSILVLCKLRKNYSWSLDDIVDESKCDDWDLEKQAMEISNPQFVPTKFYSLAILDSKNPFQAVKQLKKPAEDHSPASLQV